MQSTLVENFSIESVRAPMTPFNTLSNLVADAGDLIASIGKSADPEMQALKAELRTSIDEIRRQARQTIRQERLHRAVESIPYRPQAIALVTLAVGIGVTTLLFAARRPPRAGH